MRGKPKQSLDGRAAVCSLVRAKKHKRMVYGKKDGPKMVKVGSYREEHAAPERDTEPQIDCGF